MEHGPDPDHARQGEGGGNVASMLPRLRDRVVEELWQARCAEREAAEASVSRGKHLRLVP